MSRRDRFADGGYVAMFIFFFGFNVSPCCEALASHKGRVPKGSLRRTERSATARCYVCLFFFVDLMFPHDGTAGVGGGEDLNFKFYDVY